MFAAVFTEEADGCLAVLFDPRMMFVGGVSGVLQGVVAVVVCVVDVRPFLDEEFGDLEVADSGRPHERGVSEGAFHINVCTGLDDELDHLLSL